MIRITGGLAVDVRLAPTILSRASEVLEVSSGIAQVTAQTFHLEFTW